eukprot:GHVS01073249.1.p1 GENE.GHVS01073249.1~~GHVS01073249.1.p1  ORF type:complete len:285 (+),score=14.23 GHVS01073249.1:67-921(+)
MCYSAKETLSTALTVLLLFLCFCTSATATTTTTTRAASSSSAHISLQTTLPNTAVTTTTPTDTPGPTPSKNGSSAPHREGCSDGCSSCHLQDWNFQWVCYECQNGRELWFNRCLPSCQLGEFRYGTECRNCPRHCDKCTGSEDFKCTKCAEGFTPDSRNVCLSLCEDGQFALHKSGCGECDRSCSKCIDKFASSCTACPNDSNFRPITSLTGTCRKNCPLGFYREGPFYDFCKPCSKHCSVCDDLHRCLRCHSGTYHLHYGRCYKLTISEEAARLAEYLRSPPL